MIEAQSTKSWLDQNVVPLLTPPLFEPGDNEASIPQLTIHSEIHSPPERFDLICVWLTAPTHWEKHVRRILKEHNFQWDYMRELQKVVVGGDERIVFGGDGMPFVGNNGMASARLFKKVGDVGLILEIGQKFDSALLAQTAIKSLFTDFQSLDGLDVQGAAKEYTPAFGEA